MPSINDVLKEKFKVTGNNIAETLSKIEPGFGGGSLIVPVIVEDNWIIRDGVRTKVLSKVTLQKTAAEIIKAAPNIIAELATYRHDDPDNPFVSYFYKSLTTMQIDYPRDGQPVEDPETGETSYLWLGLDYESLELTEYGSGTIDFAASSPDEYPTYTNTEELGG